MQADSAAAFLPSSEAVAASAAPTSTRRSLSFVYFAYAFRFLQLGILVPFYARVLGTAEYGRVLAAMSLFQIVWIVGEYGFATTGIRDTAACRSRRDLSELYGAQISARALLLVPACAVGVIGTIASPLLREAPHFGLLATASGLLSAFNLGWYFQGQLRFRTSVLLEVLGFAINLALVLSLVRGRDDGWLVLAALSVSAAVCTSAAHYIAWRGLGEERLRPGLASGVRVIRQSTPLFAGQALVLLTAGASTYVVSLVAAPEQVGCYGLADRICALGVGLLLPANQVLVGTVSRWLSTPAEVHSAHRLVRRALLVLPLSGLVMVLGTHALAATVVPWVIGDAFEGALPILLVLSWIFPLAALIQVIGGQVLVPLRRDGTVLRISLLTAFTSVGLMLVLGAKFQGAGVAWARVVGAFGACAALLATSYRDQAARQFLAFSRGRA